MSHYDLLKFTHWGINLEKIEPNGKQVSETAEVT